jgi:hypothetical protein
MDDFNLSIQTPRKEHFALLLPTQYGKRALKGNTGSSSYVIVEEKMAQNFNSVYCGMAHKSQLNI